MQMQPEELDLTGTYRHNLDAKNRINFPAKLRERFGETFWIARGTSGHFLAVYSVEGWRNVMRQIRSMTGRQGEKLRRWICSGAVEVTPDKQGRVLIPAPLCNYASLTDEVVIAGAGTKVEIWSADLWDEDDAGFDPSEAPQIEEICL